MNIFFLFFLFVTFEIDAKKKNWLYKNALQSTNIYNILITIEIKHCTCVTEVLYMCCKSVGFKL